jgi:hypothetical protein
MQAMSGEEDKHGEEPIMFVEPLSCFFSTECDNIAREIWVVPEARSVAVAVAVSQPEKRKHTAKARQHTAKAHNHAETHTKLKQWITSLREPYVTSHEAACVAATLGVTQKQVRDFCNNYRKRYHRVGNKVQSYIKVHQKGV